MTATCSSELVPLARSAAVVAANSASSEPSVAKRILVGKMLNLCDTPGSRLLGNRPTNHLRQYAMWTFGVVPALARDRTSAALRLIVGQPGATAPSGRAAS